MYNILYIDDSKIKYKDKVYNINIAFNRVLKAMDVFEDGDLDSFEKTLYMFNCFIDQKTNLNIVEKSEVVNKIFSHMDQFTSDRQSPKQEKVMDIKQDFEHIYSSFLKDYGIDLIEQIDKLSWVKFGALLRGLSKDTKMAEVIRIRTMEIPKPTKDNAKDRTEILNQKAYYMLEGKEDNFQDQLNDLFNVLKKQAKRKK